MDEDTLGGGTNRHLPTPASPGIEAFTPTAGPPGNHSCRPCYDGEAAIWNAEPMIKLAMIHVIAPRLTPMNGFQTSYWRTPGLTRFPEVLIFLAALRMRIGRDALTYDLMERPA